MRTIYLQIIRNTGWSFSSQVICLSLGFISSIIMMRWISPSEYGMFFFILIFFNFIGMFRDVGLSNAIIRDQKNEINIASSAFWLTVSITSILAIIVLTTATIFASNSMYSEVIKYMTFDFIIGAIGIIPIAILNRNMSFQKLFLVNVTATLISSSVGIYLAIHQFGILSLIFKSISLTTITAILAFTFSKWLPKLSFSLSKLKNSLSFSYPIVLNDAVNFWVRNIDDFLIGSILGIKPLGFYNRAYYVMLLPVRNLSGVMSNVLYPLFSRISASKDKVKAIYLNTCKLISTVVVPAMVFLIFFTEEIVQVLFGDTWVPMVNTLKILALLSIFQSIASLVGIVFFVYNETKLYLKINLLLSIYMILCILFGIYYFKSIEGVALSYTIASLTAMLPSFYFSGKIINLSVTELITTPAIPIILSTISCFIAIYVTPLLSDSFMSLLLYGIIVTILYISSFYSIKRYYIGDFIKQFKIEN